MIKKIFHSKIDNLTSVAFLISFSTILSGFLGIFRDRLLASSFGAGHVLDIYFVSLKLPDLIQNVLVAGGIGAAFLPIFSEEFRKDKNKAFAFANNLLNCSSIVLVFLSVILYFLAPQILRLIAPGFESSSLTQAIFLTRIMLLSPIFFGLSAVFSGMLQYFGHFFVYSLAPIFYNLGIIFGILFFVPKFGIYGLGLGVVFGALIYLIIQILGIKATDYFYQGIVNLRNYRLKSFIELMASSSVGSLFLQLNLIVMTALCSTLTEGSITIFSFAKNFQNLPVSIIALPFAIAVFPSLSRAWAHNDKETFRKNFSLTLKEILFFIVPISSFIFILRAQIVRIILGAGLWGWHETRLTAACLGIFSLSMLLSSVVLFLRKAFYSIKETKIPTFIDIMVFFLNIGFSLLFLSLLGSSNMLTSLIRLFLKLEDIKNIQVLAFPLAITLSGLFQIFLSCVLFLKKTTFLRLRENLLFLRQTTILALISAFSVWVALKPLSEIFSVNTFLGIFYQTALASLFGAIVYLIGAVLMKSCVLKSLSTSFFKKR